MHNAWKPFGESLTFFYTRACNVRPRVASARDHRARLSYLYEPQQRYHPSIIMGQHAQQGDTSNPAGVHDLHETTESSSKNLAEERAALSSACMDLSANDLLADAGGLRGKVVLVTGEHAQGDDVSFHNACSLLLSQYGTGNPWPGGASGIGAAFTRLAISLG